MSRIKKTAVSSGVSGSTGLLLSDLHGAGAEFLSNLFQWPTPVFFRRAPMTCFYAHPCAVLLRLIEQRRYVYQFQDRSYRHLPTFEVSF
jgi:hypothetical protein